MVLGINARFYVFVLFYVTIFYGLCDGSADSQTRSLEPPLRVAIVGAGVAGASAALHLHNLSHSGPISITIYDSQSIVGGRVVSVPTLDAPQYIVEAGAPSFFEDDDCLAEGLKLTGLGYLWRNWNIIPNKRELWNGQAIVIGPSCNLESPTWRDLASLIARYGISVWRFHRAISSTCKRWKALGVLSAFDDVSYALKLTELDGDLVFGSAETYFLKLGISPKFLSEFVEPCTRARFSQNIGNVNAFSAIMAARKGKENRVDGGNARLIERMINISGADLRLNSTVRGITSGDAHRYRLSIASPTPYMNPADKVHSEYDIVILAFPLREGNINLNVSDFSGRRLTSDFSTPQLYAESHVTHFSTSATISAAYFNSSLNASIPDDLLTTAESDDIIGTSKSWVCYNRWCDPGPELDECDECDDDENMYRVVSRGRLSHNDLSRLIKRMPLEDQRNPYMDITWVHRRAWSWALPTFGGRDGNSGETGGKIEIVPHLFYIGGVDSVLGSMEMSCRMGRNVARLLLATRPGGLNELDDVSHSEL